MDDIILTTRDDSIEQKISDTATVVELFATLKRQLREEQRMNQQAERLAVLGFWEWDVIDDRLTYCSDGYARMLDMTREEMLAARSSTAEDHKFIHADDMQRYADAEEQVTESGKGLDIVYRVVTPTGRVRHLHEVSEVIRDESGTIVRESGIVQDVTALRVAERALQTSNEELARSNKDLEQFAYVASHDIKAPLRSIEVLVGWLEEDLADFDNKDAHENLGALKQRTARLNKLLEDLLEYSRTGRSVTQQSRTDCKTLVQDIAELLNIPDAFNLVLSTDLPVIDTLAAPLEQVLRNLISNAVKHHLDSKGTIQVDAEQHDDHYLFSVTDDGPGIPEEYAEKVFEMFQTLRPRDEVEGSGMGLAIVNRIVNWQGGRIWIETAPGGTGAVFKFKWMHNPSVLNEKDAA